MARYYFCHKAGLEEACYSDICIKQQMLLSFKLAILVARKAHHLSALRSVGRWWK
jgi:hypothetical protein